jgi:hypothetical protein
MELCGAIGAPVWGNVMKITNIRAALLLAAMSMSAPLAAQTTAPASETIVVTGAYQKMWTQGDLKEKAGLAELSKAQNKLANANAAISKSTGSQSVNAGKASNAEAEFRHLTVPTPDFTVAEDASIWADKVALAAKNWKNSLKAGDKDNKSLSGLTKKKENAEAAVNKAQARIDEGRRMKAEAQRLSAALK